jgi:drug/metabolite transporter (DMT)-like permease
VRYHVFQVVWLQTVVAFTLMLAAALARGGLARLRTRQYRLHALRGLLTIISINAAFYSYANMPLADVYAVLFTVPLLVTALSVPMLRETVGWRRWTAVLVGFSGVLLMIRPGNGLMASAVLVPLASAIATAIGFILVRKLQATETTESMGVYGNIAMLVAMAPLLPAVFRIPTQFDMSLSLLGGGLGAIGFVLLVQAYRAAPVAVIAPFQYSQMPFAVLAGLMLFDDRPEPMVLAGAAIVAASGVYILHREAGQRAAPTAAVGPAQPVAPAQASQ